MDEENNRPEESDNSQLAFGFTALGLEKITVWELFNCLEYPTFKRYFNRRKFATDIELKILGWFTADKDFIKIFSQANVIVCTEGYKDLALYFAGLFVRLFTREIIFHEVLGVTLIVHKDTSLEYFQKGYNIESYGDPFIDALARKAFKRVQRLNGVEG